MALIKFFEDLQIALAEVQPSKDYKVGIEVIPEESREIDCPFRYRFHPVFKWDGERTQHSLVKEGKNLGMFKTDTIFIDSIPHLVLEWKVFSDGTEVPEHPPIPLDPSKHHVLGWENCKYLYELPVEDPR